MGSIQVIDIFIRHNFLVEKKEEKKIFKIKRKPFGLKTSGIRVVRDRGCSTCGSSPRQADALAHFPTM